MMVNLFYSKTTRIISLGFILGIIDCLLPAITSANELSPKVYYEENAYPNVVNHSIKKGTVFIQYLIEAERSTHYAGLGTILKESPDLFFDIIARYPDIYATYVNNHPEEFEDILKTEKAKKEKEGKGALNFQDMLSFFRYRDEKGAELNKGFCRQTEDGSFKNISALPSATHNAIQGFYKNFCIKNEKNSCGMSATNFHYAICRALKKDYAYKDSLKNCAIDSPSYPPCDPTHLAVLRRSRQIGKSIPEATQALLATYCKKGAQNNPVIRKIAYYPDDHQSFDPSNYEFELKNSSLQLSCTYPVANHTAPQPENCVKSSEILKCFVSTKELCSYFSSRVGETSAPKYLDKNNPFSFYCGSTHSIFMNTVVSADNKRPYKGGFEVGEIQDYSTQLWSDQTDKKWNLNDSNPIPAITAPTGESAK